MSLYYIISIVIVLATIFAYFNQRVLKLPNNIGVMIIAIVVSGLLMLTSDIFPSFFKDSISLIRSVDFTDVLIGVLLNFLLFAGTIQVKIKDLRSQQLPVILFATLGVVISAFVAGGLMYFATRAVHMNIKFEHCLLFGALISPTDPVSVLGILKDVGIPKSLETKIAGESLFNDGVAIILFVTILHGIHNPDQSLQLSDILTVFVKEVLGAIALGLIIGFIGLRALKTIDDHKIHVMITLAIVMGGYILSKSLGTSAPLTMVSAGIFIGNYGNKYAISDVSRDYIDKFWELIDEILNVILFVLIGFELLLIKDFGHYWLIGLISIPVVLMARFVSILLPSFIIRLQQKMPMRVIAFLTWGGLRGGISIALALNLTNGLHRDLFVFITYCIVVFSIVVQGLTFEKFINRKTRKKYTEEV